MDSFGKKLLVHNVKADERGVSLFSRGMSVYYRAVEDRNKPVFTGVIFSADNCCYTTNDKTVKSINKNPVSADVARLRMCGLGGDEVHYYASNEEVATIPWGEAHAEILGGRTDSVSALRQLMIERKTKAARRRKAEYVPEAATLVFYERAPEEIVLELFRQKMIAANLAQFLLVHLAFMNGISAGDNLMRYDAFAQAHGLEPRCVLRDPGGYPFPIPPRRVQENERPVFKVYTSTGSSPVPR